MTSPLISGYEARGLKRHDAEPHVLYADPFSNWTVVESDCTHPHAFGVPTYSANWVAKDPTMLDYAGLDLSFRDRIKGAFVIWTRLVQSEEPINNIIRMYSDTVAGFMYQCRLKPPTVSESAAQVILEPPVTNKAVAAVTDLQDWLNVSIDEVATLTGTSKSAILYWKRENALPRPGTARNLYGLHALVRALKAILPSVPPMVSLRQKPSHGDLSPYELLQGGHYQEAEVFLRDVIFPRLRKPVSPEERLLDWQDVEERIGNAGNAGQTLQEGAHPTLP